MSLHVFGINMSSCLETLQLYGHIGHGPSHFLLKSLGSLGEDKGKRNES